jgi:uncharacterized membrane protein
VKIIGIKVETVDRGEFVLDALQAAAKANRVTLDDLALVTKDDEGKVQIRQTKDVTVGKGAKRGTLVGALVGLAAPPILGAAAVGAGIGAVWGKFRDRGVDDDLMKRVGGMIAEGQAVVFAMGDNASIDAIEAKVAEQNDEQITSFTIDDNNEALVREAAVDLPEQPSLMERMPYS